MWLVHPMISDKGFEIIATMALMEGRRGRSFHARRGFYGLYSGYR